MTKSKKLVVLEEGDFKKQITPKKVKDPKALFLFQCPKCGNVHFRHAGYVETLMPFVQADKKKRVTKDDYGVSVCTKCKSCYIHYDSQMYDITKLIDIKAWEKTEKELMKTTGPGGQC